ncbi:MAG TPA: tetratricopeptide repeat protein [Thermoanaerobaculia bacterium]
MPRRMSQRRKKSRKTAAVPASAPAQAAPRKAVPEDRLGWVWSAGVFAFAALVRLIVASQLGDTTLFQSPQLDSLEYLVWAKKVAAGEMIWPVPPPHGLGYPVFLGVLLRLFDGSLAAARTIQALLGAGSCLLAAAIGSRAFGRRTGIAAGVVLALCAPLVFLEVSLLGEGLLVFLLLLALWVFTAIEKPVPRAVVTGVVLAAATLVRPTALVLLPILLALLVLERPRERRAWTGAGLLLAAFLVVAAPVIWKISRANAAFVPVQGYSGYAFYIGNRLDGDGLPSPRLGRGWELLVNEAARAGVEGPAAQDRYYRDKAFAGMRERPGTWLSLLASKALWLVQAEEIRDSHSYYFFEDQSGLLRLLPGFGLLFALAACGIGIAVARRRLPRAVLLYLIGFAAATVITMVGTRYRIPLAPALAIFAGLALVWAWDAARARRRREIGLFAVAFLAALGLAHARAYPPSHNLAEEWTLTGMSLEKEEDFQAAAEAYDKALAADPGYVSAWEGIGRSRIKQGDLAGAEEALRKALQVDPRSQPARFYLGVALRQAGRTDEAVRELRESLALAPEDVPTLHTLGELLLAGNDFAGAQELFQRIVAQKPDDAAAQLALARIAGATNRPAEGIAAATRAAELKPEDPEAWLLLARLALGAQDAAAAERALQRVDALVGRENPQVALTWALLYRLQGRFEEADQTLRGTIARYPGFQPAVALFLANAAEQGRRAEAEAFLRSLGPSPP